MDFDLKDDKGTIGHHLKEEDIKNLANLNSGILDGLTKKLDKMSKNDRRLTKSGAFLKKIQQN